MLVLPHMQGAGHDPTVFCCADLVEPDRESTAFINVFFYISSRTQLCPYHIIQIQKDCISVFRTYSLEVFDHICQQLQVSSKVCSKTLQNIDVHTPTNYISHVFDNIC